MKKYITIKQALLRTNIVYSVLIIGIFSAIMAQRLYEAEASKAHVLVQQQNETISVAIKSHYAKIVSLIQATTHLDFVRNSAANPYYQ